MRLLLGRPESERMKERNPRITRCDGITERWSGGRALIRAPKLYLIGFRIPFECDDQTVRAPLVELSEHWVVALAWCVVLVSVRYHLGTNKMTIATINATAHHAELKPMTSARLRGSSRR